MDQSGTGFELRVGRVCRMILKGIFRRSSHTLALNVAVLCSVLGLSGMSHVMRQLDGGGAGRTYPTVLRLQFQELRNIAVPDSGLRTRR
jgi:hypothetical protein